MGGVLIGAAIVAFIWWCWSDRDKPHPMSPNYEEWLRKKGKGHD